MEQLLTANLGSPLDDADLLSSYLEGLSVGGSVGTSDKVSPHPFMSSFILSLAGSRP